MIIKDGQKLELTQTKHRRYRSIAPQQINLEFCVDAKWVHIMECGHMCSYDTFRCCVCEFIQRKKLYRDMCSICEVRLW